MQDSKGQSPKEQDGEFENALLICSIQDESLHQIHILNTVACKVRLEIVSEITAKITPETY